MPNLRNMNESPNCRKIDRDGEEYAIIIDGNELPSGLHFYTGNDKFVQLASWKYDHGHVTSAHSHKIYERVSTITQELVYVKQGSLEVSLFDGNNKIFSKETLKEGMAILIFKGGHQYRILEDGTEVIEVKNGPYPGLEKDKQTIEDE